MVKSTNNTKHYTWGPDCDGWHLVQLDSLSVIQEKMPPGASENIHYHETAQQFFYILKGTATFEVEGSHYIVHEKEGFHILPRKKHSIRNRSAHDLEFLVISQPKAHGDRVNL